jgi:hypothetical protein
MSNDRQTCLHAHKLFVKQPLPVSRDATNCTYLRLISDSHTLQMTRRTPEPPTGPATGSAAGLLRMAPEL